MGANIRPNDLADLCKWDADLKITCRRCGRWAVFDLLPVLNHFRARGWNTAWDCIASHFVCRGTVDDAGCGSRQISPGMAPRMKPPPPVPKVTEIQARQMAKRERR